MLRTSFNHDRVRRSLFAAVAGAALCMTAPAIAQQQQQPAPQAQPGQTPGQVPGQQQGQAPAGQQRTPSQYALGEDYAWFKLCNENPNTKKEQCLTSAELRDEQSQQLLASVSLLEQEDGGRLMLIGAPIGVLLPPGAELQVDSGEARKIQYTLCQPNNCVAQVELTDEIINSFKAGTELKLFVVNPRREKVRFTMTLQGFTKAHEGEPMTREQYEERISQLDSKIEDFVQKRREQMEQQQEGGAGEGNAGGGQQNQ